MFIVLSLVAVLLFPRSVFIGLKDCTYSPGLCAHGTFTRVLQVCMFNRLSTLLLKSTMVIFFIFHFAWTAQNSAKLAFTQCAVLCAKTIIMACVYVGFFPVISNKKGHHWSNMTIYIIHRKKRSTEIKLFALWLGWAQPSHPARPLVKTYCISPKICSNRRSNFLQKNQTELRPIMA